MRAMRHFSALNKKMKQNPKLKKSKKEMASEIAFSLIVAIAIMVLTIILLNSCGTTKMTATIHQPKDGSSNTITITTTTNTPIQTNIEPATNVEFKTKKGETSK